MAGITALVLRCMQLNIMRCGIFPGWEGIEIRQEIVAVIVTGAHAGRDMAYHYVFIGSFRRTQGIIANLKCHNRWLAGTAGDPLIVYGYVTAVAVFVGYGVAYLAGQVTKVLLVLGVILGICPDILMAVCTLYRNRV